jgi:hypothetical protein
MAMAKEEAVLLPHQLWREIQEPRHDVSNCLGRIEDKAKKKI